MTTINEDQSPKGWWLCSEHGEKFIIHASSLAEATEVASLWGPAIVLRKLYDYEVEKVTLGDQVTHRYIGGN